MSDDMRSRRTPAILTARLAVGLSLLPLVAPGVSRAQAVMPVANPDADRLGDVVRRLGASPRDLSALVEAGELSFRLGDVTAAAAFYKRAEAIDPNNARVKAGIARILVNGERPGEALRYFDTAQRLGAPMPRYADDRGLAYDLIGEQDRAQREYRIAMAQGGQPADEVDEVRRRYALSLGISGRQEEALAQIDALLRRSDRGAWRARAFILAMNGDVAGANKIATSMMPPGMASGLAAFFQRLPSLNAADRAFAVHFGEVAPTPARLADARMVPVLPALGADPTAPRRIETAAVTPAAPVAEARRPSRAELRRRSRIAADRARQTAAASSANAPAAVGPAPAAAPPPTRVASAQAAPPAVGSTPTPAPVQVASTTSSRPAVAAPVSAGRAPVPAASITPPNRTDSAPVTPRPTAVAATVPARTVPAPAAAAPVQTASVVVPASRPTPPRLGEDSILARIVAGISVPGSELGITPPAPRIPVVAAPPAPAAASLEEVAAAAERNVTADDDKRQKLAAARQVTKGSTAEKPAAADPARTRTASGKAKPAAAREKPDSDEPVEEVAAKPGRSKAAATKEPVAETDRKGKAAAKRAEPTKERAEKKETPRIWVQVAGGANAGDLPKAWKSAQSKAKALAGRDGYTTPSRATNRVVTGPFKTEAEARTFVNTLSKQGLSAFTFTSEAGQKMTRLGGK